MLDKTNMILQVPHNSRHYCDCELVYFFPHDIQAVSHPNNLSMEEIQGMAVNRECLNIILLVRGHSQTISNQWGKHDS